MKLALVIGINDYPVYPLKGCVNDATAVAEILRKNGDGSPNFDVHLSTNVPTRAALRALIKKLFSSNADLALFYFSGHGYLNEIGGYIVTPDFAADDEGILMDEILQIANLSKAVNKIIILDCCHSGAFGDPKLLGGKMAQISEGMTILTASKDKETAVEVNGHGIFTNLLLAALEGGAADLNGQISPGSIYAFIDHALGPWSQRPVFKTHVTRFSSLRTVNPQIPLSILREIVTIFPDPQKPLELNPSFEFTNSPDVKHEIKEPYADLENVAKFKKLQKMAGQGLVVPINTEHMYFAAMNSQSCQLTPLGMHYWQLIKENRI
jgi:uncharacterized caspase-like protein